LGFGCSSSSGGDGGPAGAAGSAGSAGSGGATGADASYDAASTPCVAPGTPNNEVGIGGYCEPGTSQCITDAGIRFCTGSFDAPDDAWFCTKPCVDDPECGTGAYCAHDARGSGCTPNICGNPPPATDSGTDSASTTDANDSGDAQGD
jgi:hypothetical protein